MNATTTQASSASAEQAQQERSTSTNGAPEAQQVRTAAPWLSVLAPEKLTSAQFRLACRMLRNAGHLDTQLPGQGKLSALDYFHKQGLAISPRHAAIGLLAFNGLLPLFIEVSNELENQND